MTPEERYNAALKRAKEEYETAEFHISNFAEELNEYQKQAVETLQCSLEKIFGKSELCPEPEAVNYWTATDPDGKQYAFLSKPVRRQKGWGWDPSGGGSFIGAEGTAALIGLLGLPKLTWEDEPYKFTVSKPKRNGNG